MIGPNIGPSDITDAHRIKVSKIGVVKLLKNINPSKATGHNRIPGKLLRVTATGVAPALTYLFQTLIDQSKIPNDWKTAKVEPVYKKGDHSKPPNYRSISLAT